MGAVTSGVVDDRHASYVGWVAGMALKNGVRVLPVTDDDGNYTDRLRLPFISDHVTVDVVVPYPPDDWTAAPDDDGEA